MKLLRVFGPFRFIEGLSLPPEIPPQEKPPIRAPAHHRLIAAPPSSTASSSSSSSSSSSFGARPSTSGPHLEERVDRLEAHYVGVTA
ncbi:unnamed protein product [Linum trigynum]|uniref:Uncharacterized protein n=1 Tax=Linum trigynum TaxID=586398 RepID=A0AAV2CG80_9ROSI